MLQGIIIEKVVKLIAKQFKLDKILAYVEEPNELDGDIKKIKKRILVLESNSHKPRDFVICEVCKNKIKEK